MRVNRDQIVVVTAIKYFKKLILSYKGNPKDFKTYLLDHLAKKDNWADDILAQTMEELAI